MIANARRLLSSTLLVATSLSILVQPTPALAQRDKRATKTKRALPPKFSKDQFDGVFFDNVRSMLKGQLPSEASASPKTAAAPAAGSNAASSDPMAWHKLIAAASLEDLVKGSKLRLDKLITTPTAFAGGGFNDARREFSLQALLFAIIENYPEDVRWKSSAARARESFSRAAANTKVGSIQSYNEAKQRLLDLGDLMNGSSLAGEAKSEVQWSQLIDVVPLMKLLEWAHEENLSKLTASESSFNADPARVRALADLVAVLAKTATIEDMTYADDDDYVAYAREMLKHARDVAQAAESGNAGLARAAAAQIGQSCARCHEDYR